jgi:hypothetical protein
VLLLKYHAVCTAQTITMKTLKFIFSLLTVTLILSSCSPQALDDDQNANAVEDIQATGDETAHVNNGSKK